MLVASHPLRQLAEQTLVTGQSRGPIAATLSEKRGRSDGAAEELLARATDASPLPPHKFAELAGRAAGNPLFLRELVSQVAGGDSPQIASASSSRGTGLLRAATR